MNSTFKRLFEKIRHLAAEPPDTHLSDTLNELVDLAVGDIQNRNYSHALRTLKAIKECSDELRILVPSSGQSVQSAIEEIQQKAYVHRLEVVAFGHAEFKHNRQLIDERRRAAQECDEFVQEAIGLSIAHLDPQPVL